MTPHRTSLVALCCLFALTVLVYGSIWQAEFVSFDDPQLILENPQLRDLSPAGLVAIFTPRPGASYQPLRVLSYGIDWKLFGTSATGYHAHNLLLHLLAACCFFLFLQQLLADRDREMRVTIGLFATALFLLHPVQVESVAWASSRKYGLLVVCVLGSCYCLLRWVRSKHWPWYVASLALAIASAGASPFGTTMVAVVWAILAMQPGLSWRKTFLGALPFSICMVAALPLFMTSEATAADQDLSVIKGSSVTNCGLGLRTFAMLGTYVRSLGMPAWLNARYVDVVQISWTFPLLWLGAVAACGLIALTIVCWRKGERLPAFCLFWITATGAPVSGLVPISTLVADRYVYLPGVGVWLLVGYGLARAVRPPTSRLIVLALLACILAVPTRSRTQVWQNSIALWEDCVRKDARNHRAHSSLATEYGSIGRTELALEHFQKAIQLNDHDAFSYYNLGLLLAQLGRDAEAQLQFSHALKLKPNHSDVLNNLGVTHLRLGQLDQARQLFLRATEQEAQLALPHIHLGGILATKGDFTGAAAHYQTALSLEPGSLKALDGVARLAQTQGNHEDAIEPLRSILRERPNHAPAHNSLGNVLMQLGRYREAAECYQAAATLRPDLAGLRQNLEKARAMAESPGPDTNIQLPN